MRYVIVPKNPALGGMASASLANVRPRVAELSGRDVLGYASVARKLRREGMVYVAVRREGDRERFGSGFLLADTENAEAMKRLHAMLPAWGQHADTQA